MLSRIWKSPNQEAKIARMSNLRGEARAICIEDRVLPELRQAWKWPLPMSSVRGTEPIIMDEEAAQNPHDILEDL